MGGWQAMVLENAGDIYLYKEKAGETTHEGKQMISLPSRSHSLVFRHFFHKQRRLGMLLKLFIA